MTIRSGILLTLLSIAHAETGLLDTGTPPPPSNGGPVIVIWGQSNALGYSVPLHGVTIPPCARYIRNGVEQTQYHATLSGIEAGLIERLTEWGVCPIVVTHAYNSSAMMPMLSKVDTMFAELDSFGLVPDEVIVIHGETDATNDQYWEAYGHRLAGRYEKPHGVEYALMPRVRERYGPVRFVVTELRDQSQEDPTAEPPVPASLTLRPWSHEVRAQQHLACAIIDNNCRLAQTERYSLYPGGVHYDSQGAFDLGWDAAGYGRIDGLW